MISTQAYMNHGRWICDCPRPFCANALKLQPKQAEFYCAPEGGCQQVASVEWPDDVDEITRALSARPVLATRNWAPAGHRQAIACGFPEGQAIVDLLLEQAGHMEAAT